MDTGSTQPAQRATQSTLRHLCPTQCVHLLTQVRVVAIMLHTGVVCADKNHPATKRKGLRCVTYVGLGRRLSPSCTLRAMSVYVYNGQNYASMEEVTAFFRSENFEV